MSWLGAAWKFRVPVVLNNSANAGGTQDADIPVPVDLDLFWRNVLSTGADIRVTAADGIGSVPYKRFTWNYATKSATIQLDNVAVQPNGLTVVWLYWGNPNAADAQASFSAASPITGTIWQSAPRGRVVVVQPERFADLKPRTQFSKLSSEETRIFWDWRAVLLQRQMPYEGSRALEEIQHILLGETQQNGSVVAGSSSYPSSRATDGVVSTIVRAGTSGQTYTAVCRVFTSLGRTLEARALVRVQDVKE